LEGVLSRPETLQQHLLWQLQLEPADSELRAVAAVLIQNLDDDGFHKEPPDALFKQTEQFPIIPPPRLEEAMHLVRALDPAGCCTANYRESLKAQISLLNGPDCLECALDQLELFERGKIAEAAKKMHCGEGEARACLDIIKKLAPFPGRSFTAAEIRFVVPDVQVVRDGNDFSIIINNEVIPVLGINPFFKKLETRGKPSVSGKAAGESKAENADRTAQNFARDNVREAKFFMNSIAMRNNTLKLVAQSLVEFQKAFFMKGPQHLVPLTLGDIAEGLGIHEATVSRTANGKYMQTEWGIFELRYFFTNSISGAGSDGSRFSKEGVKAVIQELIGAEKHSLSDSDIADLLARRGISLARRTVAKYRKELDLGSSYTR
jgi:RNA polymerase sigma-54 factor